MFSFFRAITFLLSTDKYSKHDFTHILIDKSDRNETGVISTKTPNQFFYIKSVLLEYLMGFVG